MVDLATIVRRDYSICPAEGESKEELYSRVSTKLRVFKSEVPFLSPTNPSPLIQYVQGVILLSEFGDNVKLSAIYEKKNENAMRDIDSIFKNVLNIVPDDYASNHSQRGEHIEEKDNQGRTVLQISNFFLSSNGLFKYKEGQSIQGKVGDIPVNCFLLNPKDIEQILHKHIFNKGILLFNKSKELVDTDEQVYGAFIASERRHGVFVYVAKPYCLEGARGSIGTLTIVGNQPMVNDVTSLINDDLLNISKKKKFEGDSNPFYNARVEYFPTPS